MEAERVQRRKEFWNALSIKRETGETNSPLGQKSYGKERGEALSHSS